MSVDVCVVNYLVVFASVIIFVGRVLLDGSVWIEQCNFVL